MRIPAFLGRNSPGGPYNNKWGRRPASINWFTTVSTAYALDVRVAVMSWWLTTSSSVSGRYFSTQGRPDLSSRAGVALAAFSFPLALAPAMSAAIAFAAGAGPEAGAGVGSTSIAVGMMEVYWGKELYGLLWCPIS